MKTMKIAAIAAMAAALLAGAGCTSTTVTQMPGAWNPKPMAPGSYTVLNGGKPVTGKVTVELGGDTRMTSSVIRQAVDQALAQCPGADALIDTTQDSQMVTSILAIGPIMIPKEMSYTVFLTGIPVKTKE